MQITQARRRRITIGFALAAGFLAAVAVVRLTNLGHYVVVAALPSGWLFAGLAGLAAAIAWWIGVSGLVARWIGTVVVVGVTALFGAIALVGATFSTDLRESRRLASPDGRFELIYLTGAAAFAPDVHHHYRIRTNDGLLAREWRLGCVPENPPRRIDWDGPGTLLVEFGPARPAPVRISVDRRFPAAT